jgi:hypothetical protein
MCRTPSNYLPTRHALVCAALAGSVSLASAQGVSGRDDVEIVETHEDITLTIEQVDVMFPRDEIDLVAGVTGQFEAGGLIFAEAQLAEKVPLDWIKETARANGSVMSFRCARITVYRVSGTRLAGGDDCRVLLNTR